MNIRPSRRRQVPFAWGTRQMRTPQSGAQRYDPNSEELKTGLVTSEGGVATLQISSEQETPAGTVNGVNTIFTLSHTPTPNTLNLFVDGVLQILNTDYTLAGNTITFAVAPSLGQALSASYLY